MDKQR
jgi:hypothetical protein